MTDDEDVPPESAPPESPASSHASDDARRGRSRRRSVIPDLVRRAVEIGVEKAQGGSDNVKQFVGDMKLPKEIAQVVFSQIDETKNGLFRVVAKELRDFLEQTNFSGEIQKLLTTVQFEVNTTIRFTPNDGKDKKKKEGKNENEKKSDKKKPFVSVTAQPKDDELADEDPLDDPPAEPRTEEAEDDEPIASDSHDDEDAPLMPPDSDRQPLPKPKLETTVQRRRR